MPNHQELPAIVTIFGATGDLTKRKLVPALFNLFLDRELPKKFTLLAVGRRGDQASFIEAMEEGLAKFSRRGTADPKKWAEFAARIRYVALPFEDPNLYTEIAGVIAESEEEFGEPATRVFYLSVPPEIFATVSDGLGVAGLSGNRERDRIVIEKPFGRDLESAEQLNNRLLNHFEEPHLYRIDH